MQEGQQEQQQQQQYDVWAQGQQDKGSLKQQGVVQVPCGISPSAEASWRFQSRHLLLLLQLLQFAFHTTGSSSNSSSSSSGSAAGKGTREGEGRPAGCCSSACEGIEAGGGPCGSRDSLRNEGQGVNQYTSSSSSSSKIQGSKIRVQAAAAAAAAGGNERSRSDMLKAGSQGAQITGTATAAADYDEVTSRITHLLLLALDSCLQSWPDAALQEQLLQEQLLQETVPMLLQSRQGLAAMAGLRALHLLVLRGLVVGQQLEEVWGNCCPLVCQLMACDSTHHKLEVKLALSPFLIIFWQTCEHTG